MATRSRRNLSTRSTLVLRARLRDLTARMRTNPSVQRVGHWLDKLQTDLRDSAGERLHEATTLASRVARQLLTPTPSGPRAVANATGILTLAGAELPLADLALQELERVARDYRTSGTHAGGTHAGGADGAHSDAAQGSAALRSVEALICELTGAEAALVFSNQAAATMAVLAALARNREVLVARSHVERLHGEFGLPAAADAAHCRLCEVGLTHRALADDYRRAISPQSALMLHSQPAEYRMAGAVALASLDELVELAADKQIPLVANLPAASLIPLGFAGATHLPVVGQSIVAGADLVIFRGDACLGGPQSAIVAGRRDLVERIAAEPLSTILGADLLTLAALGATLRLYRTPDMALRSIPLLQLLSASSENLKHRAERMAPQIRHSTAVARADVMPGQAWLSAARLADERLSSWCLRVESRGTSVGRLASELAERLPAVLTQAEEPYLWINLRSVLPRQDEQIVAAFHALGMRPAEAPSPASSAPSAAAPPTDVLESAE
jgi:L-seryl-tRNA(Ser) seleniumtransferase